MFLNRRMKEEATESDLKSRLKVVSGESESMRGYTSTSRGNTLMVMMSSIKCRSIYRFKVQLAKSR